MNTYKELFAPRVKSNVSNIHSFNKEFVLAYSRWLESFLSNERLEKLQAKNIYIYYHTFTRDVFCETVKINWIKTFACSAILMKIATFWTNTLRFRSSVKTHMMTFEGWAGICSEKKNNKQINAYLLGNYLRYYWI